MKRNRTTVVPRYWFLHFGLTLAFVLLALNAGGPALAQTNRTAPRVGPVQGGFAPPSPAKAHEDESAGVSTLTVPLTTPLPRSSGPSASRRPAAPAGPHMGAEIEPNGTYTQATLIASGQTIRANLFPNGDVDYYAFTAQAGDRVYAATMTAFSAGSSTDSQLTLFASDGATVIEFDDDNGSLASLSASIAGAVITTTGSYYIKVNDFTAGTSSERGYELYFRLQPGTPTPEVEPNDTSATANVLAASGWMSGTRDPAVATEQDWYSLTLAAGDTVFLSLDLDPERDGVTWNGRLGFGLFGDASNQIVVVDDVGASEAPIPTIPSEAFFVTVKNAGTYYAFVDSVSAAIGGPTATYNLSVDILPAANEGASCTTYTSVDSPLVIGPGAGLVSSTITIPGHPRIADLDVEIVLTHSLMSDLDVQLRSPQGNDNGLFTDIGATATGGQTQMDTIFDDEAGAPPSFTVLRGPIFKPELAYRLAWFDGEDAGGTWTLDLRDDTAGANGGALTSWSLHVCEPPPLPVCPSGFNSTTVFSTDFEADNGGFTHSGTADEWGYGLPATAATTTTNPIAAFTTCNSGVSCWKTDLTGIYESSSNQDLLSPNISLITVTAPIIVTWAQRYQIEDARFDHAYVDLQQVGGATPTRLWEWLYANMTNAPGNPAVNIGASAGWGTHTARADSLAGLNAELRFHLDTDTSINFGGLAIDDVSVQGCANIPPVADAGSDQNVYAATEVMLDGSASTDPGTSLALTYAWAQSDGPAVTLNDATAVSPTFTAPVTPTVLTFTLTVTDSLGLASAPDTVVVTVTNQAPIANAGADQDVTVGAPVELDGSASSDPDNHMPLAYGWVQTDGPVVTLSDATAVSPTFTAPITPTVLTFTLTVTDSFGLASAPDTVVVTVSNQAPIANAGADQDVTTGAPVELDGSASSDPDNHMPLAYGWVQTDGPAVTLSDATAVSPTFTAPVTPTVLTFTLTVTDSLGLASVPDTVVVTVTGLPSYASSPAPSSVITVGTAVVGTPVTTTLTISNTGSAVLNITSHSLGGPDAADFGVSPATLSIAEGSAPHSLVIQCAPGMAGLRTALLTVNHNAAGSPALYSLTCVGEVSLYLPLILR